MVVHVTNEQGTFSKSSNIKDFGKINLSEQIIELISVFNKQTNKHDWQPAIYTLGLAATKFIDLNNKTKTNSALFKYFANATSSTKTNEDIIEDQSLSLSRTNEEKSSNTSKSLTDELEKVSETISNKVPKADIKSLLLNQKNKIVSKQNDPDDSDKDADSDVLLDDNSNSNEFRIQNENTNPVIDENIDLIRCETCNKKILVWDMPEHQDFHFAQQLSREICTSSSITANTSTNKRPIEDQEKSSSILKKSNNKKIKTDNSVSNNNSSNTAKQIDKYFKKLN